MESLEATFINDSLNDAMDSLSKIRSEAIREGFDGLREFACGQLTEACRVARDAVASVLILGECHDQLPFHIRTVREVEDREAAMATSELTDTAASESDERAEIVALEFDFGDGEVPAHQHPNGKGWVADTATVADTAYIGANARVYGNARVYDHARVYDYARVFGCAWVSGNARVYGNAQVYGNARVSGNAQVSGSVRVYDHYTRVYDNEEVSGNKEVY